MSLPDAKPQNPACGCCGVETDELYLEDEFACQDCGLVFDALTNEAAFLASETPTCGAPCDNTWHRPHAITHGVGFACNPCQLPLGHTSMHWTGCAEVSIGDHLDAYSH